MKSLLLFVVLAALSVDSEAAVIQGGAVTRSNLNVGYITGRDRLLYRQYFYKPAIPNTVQYQDITYRGNYTTRITAVQATELGYTQYAIAYIIKGGIGRNNVTLRLQSARGYGYYYAVDIWGQ